MLFNNNITLHENNYDSTPKVWLKLPQLICNLIYLVYNNEAVRVAMAKIYQNDPSQFGPPSVISSPLISTNDNLLSDEQKWEKQKLRKQQEQEKKLIKKRCQRIHELGIQG